MLKARFSATSIIDKPPGKGSSNKTKYIFSILFMHSFRTGFASRDVPIPIIVPLRPIGTYNENNNRCV